MEAPNWEFHFKIWLVFQGYRQEEDVVAVIPDKDTTLNTMAVTQLLSMRATNSLSNWEFQYQYDPPALIAEKK